MASELEKANAETFGIIRIANNNVNKILNGVCSSLCLPCYVFVIICMASIQRCTVMWIVFPSFFIWKIYLCRYFCFVNTALFYSYFWKQLLVRMLLHFWKNSLKQFLLQFYGHNHIHITFKCWFFLN